MKKGWIAVLVVGLIAAFGVVSLVSAQGTTPTTPPAPGQGWGRGMRGGMMGADGQYGPMHEAMQAALAEKLGMTVDELNAAHADGKTFWDLAAEKGLTVEDAQQAMLDARGAALDAMVKEGTITQEQADWMKSRGAGRMGGRGGCMGQSTDGAFTPRGRMGGRGGSW